MPSNKPGLVGAISKAQKWQNDFKLSTILYTVLEKGKSGTGLARWGLALRAKRVDPFGFFNIDSLGKYQKKLKGGPLETWHKNFWRNSLTGRQKLEEGPFSLARYCMLR